MRPLDKIARGPTGIQRQLAPTVPTVAQLRRLARESVQARNEFKTALRKRVAAVKKSRAKNPEKYREYQREYMRRRRTKALKK